MENTIARRISDFLKAYPPYSFLSGSDLDRLSEAALVRFYKKERVILQAGEPVGAYFFVVREGAVHLLTKEGRLVETCDEGDLFGVRPLFGGAQYALTAVAAEDTLLYLFPVAGFRQICDQDKRINAYLSSILSGERLLSDQPKTGPGLQQPVAAIDWQTLQPARNPVTCRPEFTIVEAAQLMDKENVSSIIVVNKEAFPVGIITDKDLRRWIAEGLREVGALVQEIMSKPVFTVSPGLSTADIQIEMVNRHIHHLVVTEDGSDQSRVVGMLTEHDLLVQQASHPAVLIRKINRSESGESLKALRDKGDEILQKYLDQQLPIAFISKIITAINDGLTRRVIQLAEQEMAEVGMNRPAGSYCWMALGSAGRKEQVLRSDQDHALVFEDTAKEKYAATKAYYLELARRVSRYLELCGFEKCPAEMMASNPKWCISIEEWKRQFGNWIEAPTPEAVLFSNIFFDFRPSVGNADLANRLSTFIQTRVKERTPFLMFMARNAVQNPPPLSFFRNFVVERSGEYKDAFDIKARAMMPLTDAARVLSLEKGIVAVTNTAERFEQLANQDAANEELFLQAATAYRVFMQYRAKQGFRKGDSGRYLFPEELSKLERLELRNSFRPIRDLQSLLQTRFQLAHLL